MYYDMVYHITVGRWRLSLLDSVEIYKSVDILADTATVVLPGAAYNRALNIEDKLKVGDKVAIRLGYNNLNDSRQSRTEFEGWLQKIATDDGSITLTCEDDIYLARKSVEDKQFAKTTVKTIAEYVCRQVGGLTVNCTYDFRYDKFVIHKATGYDVLKKLQDEIKANIYIKDNVLHIHPAYIEIFGKVAHDFFKNIETSSLQYKRAEDRKYEVEVEGIQTDGTRVSVKVGTPGGDKRSVKIYGVSDKAMLKKRGKEELKYLVYDGYEGSITGWLLPYAEPGFSVLLKDADYEYKEGRYYAVSVKTRFNSDGGSREIELGPKLSN